MSKMDRITEKHPALSLGDLKFAGELLEEINFVFDYPKETALMAEIQLWWHNKLCTEKGPGLSFYIATLLEVANF